MSTRLKYESIKVPLPSTDQAHLTRFFMDKNKLGSPVFMLHSTLQDGSTFFSDEGTGLACYLARQGYDVFVGDMRGKGKSWPQVNASSPFGSHQTINEDIPAMVHKIKMLRGDIPQIWVGHGWGSVLMTSYYARYGSSLCSVAKMAHFAARRQIQSSNASKTFLIDFLWRRLGKLLIAFNGYMPAKRMRLGASNESRASYQDYLAWSSTDQWIDMEDGFSYGDAIRQQQLPPSFYFAASSDKAYGDPDDVREFMKELGPHDGRLMVLSRRGGNARDYNHLNMVCHKDCDTDHFPLLLDWLQQA